MEVTKQKLNANDNWLSMLREQGDDMCAEAYVDNDDKAYWLWDKFRQDIANAQSRMRDIRAYHVRNE